MSTCANAEREDCLSLGDCAMVKPDRSSAFDLVRTSASSGIVQPRCVVACKHGNVLNLLGEIVCTFCSEAVHLYCGPFLRAAVACKQYLQMPGDLRPPECQHPCSKMTQRV